MIIEVVVKGPGDTKEKDEVATQGSAEKGTR